MVGVREDLTAHLKRVVPAKLCSSISRRISSGIRQHRMRIIEVNGDLIRQILIGFMQLIMTVQDILHRRRDQKIPRRSAALVRNRWNRPDRAPVKRSQSGFIFHRRAVALG